MDEPENELSTRSKINNLINSIQNKLSKRPAYYPSKQRGNIDINTFQSFGAQGMPISQESINTKVLKNNNYNSNLNVNPSFNNYINKINNNIPQNNEPIILNEGNYPINEYYLRNIIKEEFTNLILPYQKDNMCKSNLMESKLNDIEKRFQIIINAQNMGELNDNAKIISAYLCSNLSSDNLNKNIENLKMEYNKLFDELQKKVDLLNDQIAKEKTNYNSNISNICKRIEIIEKKSSENDNKEIKTYVEKHIFDEVINNLNENHNKILNKNENNVINLTNQIDKNIKDIKNQVDFITNSSNQYKLEINNNSNKINNISNNLNSLRTDFGKITEDVSQIKYQVTPDVINKINSLDLNSLKQQISPNEFKNLKDNMNIIETNLNSIKTMAENNDRSNFDLKKLINSIEEKQNLSYKNIENLQPLLNENILDKIKTINIKIEELSKMKNNNEKKDENNNENKEDNKDKDVQNNKEEKKEEDTGIFSGGSRRQQRNNKNANNNNLNKTTNSNLDEKSLNLIKQLEKINLNELQKIDFNNMLTQINDISSENKFLVNKINEQNKQIADINEKIKNLENNNNNLASNKNTFENNNKYNFSKSEIKNDFKTSLFDYNDPYKREDLNDPYKREPKINNININNKLNDKGKEKDIFNNDKKEEDNIIEDDYDDFDKDFDDDKNDFDNKEKEKKSTALLDDRIKDNDLLPDKNNFSNYPFNKKGSKNDFGKFDKYEETNILDQIMGLGGSRRGNDINKNMNSGGTFITGSLTESKNNNINKNPIYNDNLNIEVAVKKEEKKEKIDKEDDDFKDDFDDDFDVEEI